MPIPQPLRATAAGAALLVLVLSACDDTAPDATAPPVRQADHRADTRPGDFTLCTSGAGGEFQWVERSSPGGAILNSGNVTVGPNECALNVVTFNASPAHSVTVTEVGHDAGFELQSIRVDIAPDFPANVITNVLTGTITVTVPVSGDLGSVVTYNYRGNPDLEIEKTADATPVDAGSPIGFTVTVTNNGGGAAEGVSLTDALPIGLGLNWSVSPAVSGCAINSNVLSCSRDVLAPGASVSVHVTSPTTNQTCGEYPNVAHVSATNQDQVASNEATVTVNCPADALFLVIDEDAIDNGPRYWLNTATAFTSSTLKTWSTSDVNDDRPGLAQRLPLRWFANPLYVGMTYWLWTGQVGDEGWFAPKVIPASWRTAGPTTDGLRNFLGVGNAVGSGLGKGSDPERLLDKIPHVIPLRAEGLWALIGKTVCALVWDSDISINYDQSTPLGINGSLKGEKLGIVAFDVSNVVYLSGFSSSTLPRVQVTIRDPSVVCGGPLSLYADAPEPRSSSVPADIRPNAASDNSGYVYISR